jgi:O-antigen ligase
VTSAVRSTIGRLAAWPQLDAPILFDALVILGYAVTRITESRLAFGIWFVMALVGAMRWPASGLGIAVALAVFPQPLRAGMTPSVSLIIASAIGVALDYVLTERRPGSPARAIRIVTAGALALGAATFVAMIHSLHRFEPAIGVAATLRWTDLVAGLGLLVLLMRVFSLGSRRPVQLGLVALAAVFAVALIDFVAPSVLPSLGLGWLLSGAETSRAAGSFVSPNRLGTVAAVGAIVGACQFFAWRGGRRWWWGAFAGSAAAALILSFSRGAILGLALAGLVILVGRSRRAAASYVGVLAAGALVLVPLLIGARLLGSGGTLAGLLENDAGRIDAWVAGIRMILAQPIFGHGFGAFSVLGASFGATDGLLTAHNEIIDLWAQAGVVAAGGFVAIGAGIVLAALSRGADPWARAAIGAIVAFVIASSFNVQSPFLAVTAPVWLIAAFGIARPREAGEPGPVETVD